MNTNTPFAAWQTAEQIAQEIIDDNWYPQAEWDFGNMPKHLQDVCHIINHQYHRTVAAETFKTWGTLEQIAANINFSQQLKSSPSLSELSRATLAKFFPSLPTDQNRSSLDDLE